MEQEYKFAGKSQSFESIYTDIENQGYMTLLAHIYQRMVDLEQDMELVAKGSEQYEAYADLHTKYQTCLDLMPRIIEEASYRYIVHRATPEEIENILERTNNKAAS